MEKMNLLKSVLAFAVVSLFVVDTPIVYGTHRTTEACGNKISLNMRDHGQLCSVLMDTSIPLVSSDFTRVYDGGETSKIRVGAIRGIIKNNHEAAVLLNGIGVGSKIEIGIAPSAGTVFCISVIDNDEFVPFEMSFGDGKNERGFLTDLLKHSRQEVDGYHISRERLQALGRRFLLSEELGAMKSGNCIDVRFHVD